MSEVVGEIRRRLDIVDYLSSYLSFKRQGRNFTACCPFHQEKTPSFIVFPDKQSYHCFGCHLGGDIFSFVMEYEKMTFVEALKTLAEQAGVKLDTYRSNKNENPEEKDLFKKAMLCGLDFFRKSFASPEGRGAVEYIKGRGFSQETIDLFEVGFAPNSWDGLIKFSEGRGVTLDILEKVGLVKKGDRGSHFDFFRDRVIFPVRDATNNLVGFGGRVMGDGMPKYLNSPETPLFNKRRLFFNFHQAKNEIRKSSYFLIMEGYTDVMMAEQVKMGAAVATLGTAMSEDHVKMLKRYSQPVYLVYDSDEAGQKAAERSLPYFLKHGLEVRAVTLPNKMDPCDFLKNTPGWKRTWDEIREKSPEIFSFKLQRLMAREKNPGLEQRISMAKECLENLKECHDELRVSVYLDLLSEKLKISVDVLKKHLKAKGQHKPPTPSPQNARPFQPAPSLDFKKDNAYYILAIAIEDFSYVSEYEERSSLLPSNQSLSILVLNKWIDAHRGPHPIARPEFLGTLQGEQRELFVQASIEDMPPEPDLRVMFNEKLEQQSSPKVRIRALRNAMKRAEQADDSERSAELLKELLEIQKSQTPRT